MPNKSEQQERLDHLMDISRRYYSGEDVSTDDLQYMHKAYADRAKAMRQPAPAPRKDQVVIAPEQGKYGTVDIDLYDQYRQMMADAEKAGQEDLKFVMQNRRPTLDQRINTIRMWRPGMTITPNGGGLIIPVRKR